ncbi:MAG: hypothetical protein REI12_10530 [Pedobacter sp.]|nr:hypothetical protein [Pedobacter sp.]
MAYSQRSPQSSAAKAAPRSVGFFHVQLRDSAQFKNFRTEQLDKQGRIQRIAGQRANSTAWADQELRISKDCAHIENHRLVADTDEARSYLGRLGAVEHVSGDVFRARLPDEKQTSRPQAGSAQAAPQRRAQSMADKESQALARQPGGQREQERPSPSGEGRANPPHKS